MINTDKAFALATEIAWQGHASNGTMLRLAERAGVELSDLERTLEVAEQTGMLKTVSRIGGYVAGRKVNEAVFGRKFAEMYS